MAMALYEPGLGYYVNGLHKFGSAGDFITAPEQGPLFARTLARQCTEVAEQLGDHWTLLELGAGSGTLARDLLLALPTLPAKYLILEPSAALREVQRQTLAGLPDDLRHRLRWIDAPPEEPFNGIIVANEVIDALPVARFEIGESGEIYEQAVNIEQDRFALIRRAPRERLRRAVELLQAQLPEPLGTGHVSEICIDLPGWLETVTTPLAKGLALLIDYGYVRGEYYLPERRAGSLVCHYRHRAHFDPFVWPGLSDISAFVDFTAVAEAAHDCGLEVAGFTSQAGFLLSLGAHEALAESADERQRLELSGELKRLTLPGEMGEKFKVLALSRDLEGPLSGFALMSQLHRL